MQVERCFAGENSAPAKSSALFSPHTLPPCSPQSAPALIMDGVFVSTYVGTDALAAINIVYPIVNLLSGLSLMFAVGGSTLAAIALGSKNREQASHIFSQCIFWSLLLGGCTSFMCWLQLDRILYFLGATTPTLSYCRTYAALWLLGVPAVVGKELCAYFIRINGAPGFSFFISAAGGITNIILDALFVGAWGQGVFGAGLATVMGLALSCILGIFWLAGRKSSLRVVLERPRPAAAVQYGMNGSSELVNQLAIAVTTIVFNRTALNLAGENGIAAASIIMYLQFVFLGVYFGGSMGHLPIGIRYGTGTAGSVPGSGTICPLLLLDGPSHIVRSGADLRPGGSPSFCQKRYGLYTGCPGDAPVQHRIPVRWV
ncbi:MAG: MATE family efflux transporter [Dysosmobacter sp.]